MRDPHLLPLFVFGTLIVSGFAVAIIFSLIIQKQRQVKNRLARQQLAFDYSESLLNTRIEVQETTLNMVAQELHDNIAQSLTACFMQMATASAQLEDSASKIYIDEARSYIKDVIRDVRLLSHSLATTMVEHRELQEAIQAELTRIQTFSNIRCSLRSDTLYEPEPERRLLLYRMVQEALQNILKHAKANHITINLSSSEAQFQVVIEDDGAGFDVIQSQSSLGLRNMRDRASLLQGELQIKSAPGAGTRIQIQIPILPPHGTNPSSDSRRSYAGA